VELPNKALRDLRASLIELMSSMRGFDEESETTAAEQFLERITGFSGIRPATQIIAYYLNGYCIV
jgi:hypothetical protein